MRFYDDRWVNYGLSVAKGLEGWRGFAVYLSASWSARLVFLTNNVYIGSSLPPDKMLLKYQGKLPLTATEVVVMFGVGVASSIIGWILWRRIKRHMRQVDAQEDAAFAAGHRLELTSDGLDQEMVPMAPSTAPSAGDDYGAGARGTGTAAGGGNAGTSGLEVAAYTPPRSPAKSDASTEIVVDVEDV